LISEKALSVAKEKAEANNRFKDEYLFNLSREIKAPLESIVGFSSKLGEICVNEDTMEYVSIIKNSSDLLLKLVNDTICVSLLQTEQTPFVLENIEIVQFCKNRLHDVEPKVTSGVTLNFRSSADRFIMQTDATRLKQLLEILLTNAAKFTKDGEINLIYLASQ
jgi:signal transduction histidine kinase